MTLPEIESELVRSIYQCQSIGVPQTDFDELVQLTRAGEPGVALEILCSQLVDHNVVVPISIYDGLARVGSAMQLDAKTWVGIQRK